EPVSETMGPDGGAGGDDRDFPAVLREFVPSEAEHRLKPTERHFLGQGAGSHRCRVKTQAMAATAVVRIAVGLPYDPPPQKVEGMYPQLVQVFTLPVTGPLLGAEITADQLAPTGQELLRPRMV